MSDAASGPIRPGAARILGWLVSAACLAAVGRLLLAHWAELPPLAWRWRAAPGLAAAALLVVGIEALHSLAFRSLLRAFDPAATWRATFATCGRSQLAKYLPGNVFHWVDRARRLRGQGLPLADAAAATAADALLIGASAALAGLPALGRVADLVRQAPPAVARLAALVAVAAAAAVVLRLRGLGRTPGLVRLTSPARLAPALLAQAGTFVLAGLAVRLVLAALWPEAPTIGLDALVPGFALAFALGYVSPGAPGGLGVREAALSALFAPTLGAGLAAALFLVVRAVFVAGDLLTFAAALLVAPPAVPAPRPAGGLR